MNIISSVYNFYFNGFRNMQVGKTLWKLIALKLVVIFVLLHCFIHDKSLNSEYKTNDEKSNFVYKNLIGGK